MTRFTFHCKHAACGKGRSFTGFEVSGHTGGAPAGEDLVCAAISKATELVCNTITDVYGVDADIVVENEAARLLLKLPEDFSAKGTSDGHGYEFINQYAVNGLLDGFYRWATALAEESEGCVRVLLDENK